MTKKTRIRVARIAAGAVIAAGASLTAAGAASAAESEDCLLGILCAEESPTPTPPPTGEPTGEPTVIPTGEPTDPPPSSEEPTDEPTEPTDEPTEPTEDPTDAPTNPGNGNGTGGGNGNGGGNGGGNNTDPDGGTSPREEGSSELTEIGSDATPAAPQAQAQGNGKELAETGAAQTTFLVIGAATMIAGGVGFRLLPRLVGGRGGAAA
ncbi:LPXTG cell wall anchor domain-containing protein [Streptomyces sp. NPDC007929]|uniref:LPXTG cell wall anchor domain-containing protein n=1 Tax=unclassified Streptomyces TaxID=2593676 RepID=UPI0036E04D6A